MSRPKSKLSKIIRSADRLHEKMEKAKEQRAGRIAGETPEEELARKKRDLERWVGMMSEREIEEKLEEALLVSSMPEVPENDTTETEQESVNDAD